MQKTDINQTDSDKDIKCGFFRRFYHNLHGFGMIEAVMVLPIFFVLLFGIIEFGFIYLKKYALSDAASNIASTIRDQSTISQSDLDKYIDTQDPGILGFNNVTGTGGFPWNFGIRSFTTPPTDAQLDELCSFTPVNDTAKKMLAQQAQCLQNCSNARDTCNTTCKNNLTS